MANQKLTAFVRQCLNIVRDDDAGNCQKFLLKHVNANAKQNEVQTFDCRSIHKQSDGDKRDTFIDQIINAIEEAAHDDAESLGGHQKYLLLAYYQNSTKPLARCGFRVDAGDDDDDSDEELASEPANAKGLVAQAMRHQEGNFRTSVMATNHVINMMQRTIDTQQETINTLLASKMDTIKLVEDLVSQRHERDLAAAEQKALLDMKENLVKKGMLLAPLVVNKLAGKKIMPEDMSSKEALLSEFAKSLTQEQVLAIHQQLNPAQAAAMLEILKSVLPQEEEKTTNGESH